MIGMKLPSLLLMHPIIGMVEELIKAGLSLMNTIREVIKKRLFPK
jgi:hypothetical protein